MTASRVSAVAVGRSEDLREAIARAVAGLDPAARAGFAGRRVLIKANFNSPHRYPASSDPAFLSALVGYLRDAGAAAIQMGDSCGLRWAPAAAVAAALGIPRLCERLGVAWVNFDEGPWDEIPVKGRHFPAVRIAAAAARADALVYACCVMTHPAAGFSASLKHAIGLLPPEQRRAMHRGDMAERIAEINAAVAPRLILADARRCFAAGGPAVGWVRRPGVVLASADRVALDIEAVRLLRRLRPRIHRLAERAEEEPQIAAALARGIAAPAGCLS